MGMGMGVAQSATVASDGVGAQQACEAQAAVKKLAGAAKTSFVGKYAKDAAAAEPANAKAGENLGHPPFCVRPITTNFHATARGSSFQRAPLNGMGGTHRGLMGFGVGW
ncbi:hypothetical protein [Aeromonas simiae]